jgi:hypothetical protein
VDDTFDVCWSCGTSKGGVEDPSFQKADDAEGAPSDPGGGPESIVSAAERAKYAIQAQAPAAQPGPAVESRCHIVAGWT